MQYRDGNWVLCQHVTERTTIVPCHCATDIITHRSNSLYCMIPQCIAYCVREDKLNVKYLWCHYAAERTPVVPCHCVTEMATGYCATKQQKEMATVVPCHVAAEMKDMALKQVLPSCEGPQCHSLCDRHYTTGQRQCNVLSERKEDGWNVKYLWC